MCTEHARPERHGKERKNARKRWGINRKCNTANLSITDNVCKVLRLYRREDDTCAVQQGLSGGMIEMWRAACRCTLVCSGCLTTTKACRKRTHDHCCPNLKCKVSEYVAQVLTYPMASKAKFVINDHGARQSSTGGNNSSSIYAGQCETHGYKH